VPVPDGWRAWTDADGPIPDALATRASALAADPSVPLGTTESYPLPAGTTALLRVELRTWSRDPKGVLVQGCFRTTGAYLPAAAPAGAGLTPPAGPDKLAKTISVLTVASLTVGTAATLATWSKR
jgi:hypothetical protein